MNNKKANEIITQMDETEVKKRMLVRELACMGQRCEKRDDCKFYSCNKRYILGWLDLSQIEKADNTSVCGRNGNYKIFIPI